MLGINVIGESLLFGISRESSILHMTGRTLDQVEQYRFVTMEVQALDVMNISRFFFFLADENKFQSPTFLAWNVISVFPSVRSRLLVG